MWRKQGPQSLIFLEREINVEHKLFLVNTSVTLICFEPNCLKEEGKKVKNNTVKMVTGVMLSCLYTIPAYCINLPAPTVVLWVMLYEHRWLWILTSSGVIEAALFYFFLKNISYTRAILIACLGKAVSALVIFVMAFGALPVYDSLPDVIISYMVTFLFLYVVATFILMYLGSAFIELFVIQKIFRYPYKDLWIPVCVGNLVTYSLIYMFFWQPMQL